MVRVKFRAEPDGWPNLHRHPATRSAKLSFSEERRYGAGSFASKKVIMLHAMSPVVLTLSLCLLGRHYHTSGDVIRADLIHSKIAHHPMGGKIFATISNSMIRTIRMIICLSNIPGDQGNPTYYFLIPVLLAGACAYLLLPFDLVIVAVAAVSVVFYTFFFSTRNTTRKDRPLNDLRGSGATGLHFVHHRHAICNFAVIHFFWDRVLGSYREVRCRTVSRDRRPSRPLAREWRAVFVTLAIRSSLAIEFRNDFARCAARKLLGGIAALITGWSRIP